MHAALRAKTAGFAANVLPIIREVQAAGHTSHNAIAGQLNARKVATSRGGRWTHVQVGQILDRASYTLAGTWWLTVKSGGISPQGLTSQICALAPAAWRYSPRSCGLSGVEYWENILMRMSIVLRSR
jgi:hypothetical protein